MTPHAWVKEFPAAITVSDAKGTIIKINARAVKTYEKDGGEKLIYQEPWYRDGQFAGVVEISFEIPFDLPHFVRDLTALRALSWAIAFVALAAAG